MGLTRIQKLRREEFADAAIEVFYEHGVSDATFDLVAKKAGVSKSNVLHYFESKTALIEAAFRRYARSYAQEVDALLKRTETPWERVYAVIEANFSKSLFLPEVTRAYVYLCAEASGNETLTRLLQALTKRMHSNLVFALREVTEPDRADAVAQMIGLAIRGLWLRCASEPGAVSRVEAMDQLDFLLGSLFPEAPDRETGKRRMADIQSILAGFN